MHDVWDVDKSLGFGLILCPFRRIAVCSPLWSMICAAAGSWLSKIAKYEVLSFGEGLNSIRKVVDYYQAIGHCTPD